MNIARFAFLLSGIYDFVLGLIFLFLPVCAFDLIKVTPPNHWGYVTLVATMLIIFGIMFFQIAKNPVKYRVLMPYGMLLKIAYCGVAFGYYFTTGIPDIWAIFGICSFIFLIFFIWGYKKTANAR